MSTEPWMRGYLKDLDPIQAAVLYSFRHAQEDIGEWLRRIPEEDLWIRFGNLASAGFHVRHIAGSADRLLTYAAGKQLTEAQLEEMKNESERGGSLPELMHFLDDSFRRAEERIRSLDPAAYGDIREIGRKRIPVPLGTLLVHIAEHTQRHVGELIMTVKVINEEYR
jgi:uncharacterized damage-inducible protein DinB